jgi:hypothetical protein
MKYWHKRVTVGSFFDLELEAQKEEIEHYGKDIQDKSYFIAEDGECWGMENFMRTESGRYDGVMAVTNTSAIGVVLSCSGDSAVLQLFG